MVDRAVLAAVYRFWFGDLDRVDAFPEEKSPLWFRVDPETDAYIARTFGPHLDAAADGPWEARTLGPRERVALVVLLDQFPRNIFRESAKAFAYDPAARRLADAFLAEPGPYFLVERVFLALPFEHSESLADQDRAVALMTALLAEAPATQRDYYATTADFAVKHKALIERFGRFPHRNAVLGRPSTPEEAEFLRDHGRGY